jgi:CMP-N,N'-diacetyllegionaminic acid synthase
MSRGCSVADGLRILAVVPARGGSKRLPGKNLLPLGGKPLIRWTIDAGLECGVCADLLVSTDDPEIAEVARQCGAMVPWLRPADLATDTATTGAVIAHALEWYEAVNAPADAVLLLQPTSPFRSVASIIAAVALYARQVGEPCPVVSVSPAPSHPAWTFTLKGPEEAMTPVMGWEPLQARSQDLTPAYTLNGALYVIPAADVRADLPIIRPGVRPFIMADYRESLDIDTADDWEAAERWSGPQHR